MASPAAIRALLEGVEVLGVRDGFMRYFDEGLATPVPVSVVSRPAEVEHGGLYLSDEATLAHDQAKGSGGNRYDRAHLRPFKLPDTDPDAPGQLYDLDTDPGETTNLYSRHPEIVAELDKYIIGQDAAKKMVAIALRNRWRRQQVKDSLREEIMPNNIILIGPTGVGKTEIARRGDKGRKTKRQKQKT